MPRSQRHFIVKNRTDIVARFGSQTLAQEAYYDLGCYLDERPSPADQFEIIAETEFRARLNTTTTRIDSSEAK